MLLSISSYGHGVFITAIENWLICCSSSLSITIINIMTKSIMGMKGFLWLKHSADSSLLRQVGARIPGRNLEAGIKTETTKGCKVWNLYNSGPLIQNRQGAPIINNWLIKYTIELPTQLRFHFSDNSRLCQGDRKLTSTKSFLKSIKFGDWWEVSVGKALWEKPNDEFHPKGTYTGRRKITPISCSKLSSDLHVHTIVFMYTHTINKSKNKCIISEIYNMNKFKTYSINLCTYN